MAKKRVPITKKKSVANPNEVSFRYIKSNFFRVIHSDGVFGGTSPSLAIHMSFFSERKPIPEVVVHSINEKGLGPEIHERRITKTEIIREVEIDVVLDPSAAKSLVGWLQQKIVEIESIKEAARGNIDQTK